MPKVTQDGEFTFIIHTRELPFEPPHVHVWFGGDEVRKTWEELHGPLESVFKRDTIQLQGGSMLYSNLPLPLGEGWGEG